MSKAGIDPLESAKVSSEAPAKKAKKPEAKKEEAKKPEAKAEAKKEEAKKPEVPGKAPPKFRVLANCTFSRNGHVTKLKAGAVISAQHYGGLPGIEKMRDGGLQLEEL